MKSKIYSLPEIKKFKLPELKDKTLILTNGCFDLLHIGHVQYLKAAKKLGDVLLVAVNSDNSVRKLKGEGRPIIPLKERLEVLAALEAVDLVTSFSAVTCEKVIDNIRPDIYVKGGDYTRDTLPESEIVSQVGAKLEFINIDENQSTTKIIKKIISSRNQEDEVIQ